MNKKTDFIPTINDVTEYGDMTIMQTIDPRPETNLVSREGEPLQRAGDLVTDEQKDVLNLYERH